MSPGSARLEPGRFDLLSFDCYGTLIDWESGIRDALGPVFTAHGVAIEPERILEAYAELESSAQAGDYRSYREVLAEVVSGMGRRFGFAPSPEEVRTLADSLPSWRPFADTRGALAELARRYRLAVISNVDDDLFEGSARQIGVRFDHVVTAMQARAYKPDPGVFRLALETFGVPRTRILHVAQSLFHDVAPAASMGLSTVWVNRRAARRGFGATPPSDARPDLEVADLAGLVRHLRAG